MGNGFEAESNVGPLINARQRDRIEKMVENACNAGATVAAGGKRPPGRGCFYELTVITGVSTEAPLFRNEISGPVMPIATFEDAANAITQANSTRYGLSAYVWTNDIHMATSSVFRCNGSQLLRSRLGRSDGAANALTGLAGSLQMQTALARHPVCCLHGGCAIRVFSPFFGVLSTPDAKSKARKGRRSCPPAV